MWRLIRDQPSEVFWPVFCQVWNCCDLTWDWNLDIASELRRVGPCPTALSRAYSGDNDDLYGNLPDRLTVYRGTSRHNGHIGRGFSWTLEKNIARKFASGPRFVRIMKPCIVVAEIDRSEVFWATNNRNESEIIAMPRNIEVEPYMPLEAGETVGGKEWIA